MGSGGEPLETVTVSELPDAARSCVAGGAVVVDLMRVQDDPPPSTPVDVPVTAPVVVLGIAGPVAERPLPRGFGALCDVVVSDAEAASEVVTAVRDHPLAATALVLLLRGNDARATRDVRSIEAGLVAESATYSALQAGPAFERWLARHRSRPRRPRPPQEGPAVRLDRTGDRLVLTLNRPHVHNAFDARMRDELLDGLAVAAADDSITEVVLAGAGPSFCSGGDLDEFGTFADPASAHLLRLARSCGRAVAALASRVVAEVHGSCIGAGVELPAFAGRVVAAPESSFRLPEVAMGLVPGAGGTVSLPRRIGRHRTAWLALTGRSIDAPTALAWGLVDEIQA